MNDMSPKQFRRVIQTLSDDLPRYRAIEHQLQEGTGFGNAWYSSQKRHWLGWLDEYNGPGAYGRKIQTGRDAQFIYNHIQCAPMLFWLAEALRFSKVSLDAAEQAILAAPRCNASQCAAFRSVIPWSEIEMKLATVVPGKVLSSCLHRLFGS